MGEYVRAGELDVWVEVGEGPVPQPQGRRAHLRTIFRKLGVSSRVEVARAVEHADRAASTASR
jgi:hypothetical protein